MAHNILQRPVPGSDSEYNQFTLNAIYDDSAAPLAVLIEKYPDLKVKTLSTKYSEWNHTKVDLKEVKVGANLIRFGVFREDREI